MTDFERHLKRNLRRAYAAIFRCRRVEGYCDRGITVHPPWVKDPFAFATYLLILPGSTDERLVLDRENNDGNYEPGNLRFVTLSESAVNRRNRRVSVYQPRRSHDEVVPVDLASEKSEIVSAREYLLRSDLRSIRGPLSQARVAAEACVARVQVSRVERGFLYGVGPGALVRLARVYRALGPQGPGPGGGAPGLEPEGPGFEPGLSGEGKEESTPIGPSEEPRLEPGH